MKKILSLLLIFLLTISLFTGCKKETPKETLQKSFERYYNIKTSETSFDMTLNFDIDNNFETPEMLSLQMINGSKIKGIFASDVDKMGSAGELILDMNGMAYKVNIFTSPDKVVFKIPLMNPYIIMDQVISANEINNQKEDFKKYSIEIMNIFLNNIIDENINVLDKEKISTPEGEIQVTSYEINFNNDEILKVLEDYLSYLFNNETYKNMMVNDIKKQAAVENKNLSDEEIDKMVKEMEVQMNEALENIKKTITFDSFKLIYGIDKDYNIRNFTMQTVLTAKDDENKQIFKSLKLDIESKIWNINKPVEIDMPELNEENSIKFEELFNQFLLDAPNNLQ